jgi:hypothetical protein
MFEIQCWRYGKNGRVLIYKNNSSFDLLETRQAYNIQIIHILQKEKKFMEKNR